MNILSLKCSDFVEIKLGWLRDVPIPISSVREVFPTEVYQTMLRVRSINSDFEYPIGSCHLYLLQPQDDIIGVLVFRTINT